MTVRAFFDESAMSPQDGDFMIMAGWVGEVDEFEKAAESWQECLDQSPAIPYFHSREGIGTDRNLSLAKAIGKHKLQGIVVTIPHSSFLNRDAKLVKSMFGTRIYDWAFIHTVMGVLTWVDKAFPEDEVVDFIFDKRRELDLCKKHFFDFFAAEKKGIWKRAGTCISALDKNVAALQMGDLLAGEVLDSMRQHEHTSVINEFARTRSLFLFNREPHPTIERSMTLHSLGKILWDSAREKILASPPDGVDPAIYKFEYEALCVISAMAAQEKAMLDKEMGKYYEDPA